MDPRLSLYEPKANQTRIQWDLKHASGESFDSYWKERNYQLIPKELFTENPHVWLEIGAGTGWFFMELAKSHPEKFLIAIERCRMRGKRLLKRAKTKALSNLAAYRGNAIPVLVTGAPTTSVERLYILYPCPWPKNSQRKNRWYLHPIMPHLIRILKPGGLLIWASDQKFYIDEAQFVCQSVYQLEVLAHGPIAPNSFNNLQEFPEGRTKFEATFLAAGNPCYELIVRKS